jgi:hypothetical protein
MVAAGGVGVLAVVVFVAAVAFGARAVEPVPGDRLAVRQGSDRAALFVAVARCPVERVTSVAVGEPGGDVRWRITSEKGSIDERYRVGADTPTGFVTDVALNRPLPDDAVEVAVAIDRDGEEIIDRVVVRTADLGAGQWRYQGLTLSEEAVEGRATAAADCPGGAGDRGVVVWLFGAAALVVVVTFLGMVQRWWRGRP